MIPPSKKASRVKNDVSTDKIFAPKLRITDNAKIKRLGSTAQNTSDAPSKVTRDAVCNTSSLRSLLFRAKKGKKCLQKAQASSHTI